MLIMRKCIISFVARFTGQRFHIKFPLITSKEKICLLASEEPTTEQTTSHGLHTKNNVVIRRNTNQNLLGSHVLYGVSKVVNEAQRIT